MTAVYTSPPCLNVNLTDRMDLVDLVDLIVLVVGLIIAATGRVRKGLSVFIRPQTTSAGTRHGRIIRDK
jgi:hypothetical protein